MSDSFDKLLMTKMSPFTICGSISLGNEYRYEQILIKNVIQQTNQYFFVSFRYGIDPQIVYKMLLLYILWLNERRYAMKGNPGRKYVL